MGQDKTDRNGMQDQRQELTVYKTRHRIKREQDSRQDRAKQQ